MRYSLLLALLCALCACRPAQIQFTPELTPPQPGQGPLVTGRAIDVVPLSNQNIGSMPLNMIVSADSNFLVSTSSGFREHLIATRISDGAGVSGLTFPRKKGKFVPDAERFNGLYYGLAAAPGIIYAAQGNLDTIAIVEIDPQGRLAIADQIKTRKGDFPSGLALDDNGRLYVANNDPQAVPPDAVPSSIAIYDARSHREIGRFAFADSYGGTANFPMAIAVTRDGRRLYVGSQRDDAVYVLDTSDPANIRQVAKLPTGSHPIALLMDGSQKTLFVANAHSDTVSFIDIATNEIRATVLLRPDIARSIAGATPTALALSPDEKRLYVTLGDMNAVGIIDVPNRSLEGYMPSGWYPTAIIARPDGRRLFVVNTKGTVPQHPNPPPDRPGTLPSTRKLSPLGLLEGNVIALPVPASQEMGSLTAKVLETNRLTARYLTRENPLKDIGLKSGKIKHVIYIVKENRTYDHVLGDLPQGNGNPEYCLFGREVTPNQHALAERFVLMDNFYCSGEVSGDGWTWSTQAMANEYTQRNVPYEYSDRGKKFNYEGTNNAWPTGGFPATGPDGRPLSEHPAFKDGMKPIPDVAEAPGGHLWDMARKHNLSMRNWGFFVAAGVEKNGKQITPPNYPAVSGLQPGGRDLGGITDIDFCRFDMDYPDSEAWKIYHEKTNNHLYKWLRTEFGYYDAPSRFSEWNREFQLMLKKDPSGGAVPSLMFVRLPTDHTAAASPGRKSPRAMVADNDFAIGQLVETISKSPIWKQCAIFIIEDDAQDGPDHVDAHRSTCYVISPYIRRGSIDHAFHNTSSCLKTIELLLDLPPICQYDATAAPIMNWDTEPRNAEPHQAILPPGRIIGETNPGIGEVAPVSPEATMIKDSLEMNLAEADQADAARLNEIIWKLCKGTGSAVPPTPRRGTDRD